MYHYNILLNCKSLIQGTESDNYEAVIIEVKYKVVTTATNVNIEKSKL